MGKGARSLLRPGRVQANVMAQPRGPAGDGQPLSAAVPGAEPGTQWLCLCRGNLVPGPFVMVWHKRALGAASWLFFWLCVHGILAASGTLAASLCWHCITGWEQSPTGFHRLLATGWVILEPGAAPALLAEGAGPALSRLLSALPSECLTAESGACSAPGAAPTPRGCRAGLPGSAGFGRALSHRSPALPALQGACLAPAGIPASAARASAAAGGSEEHHPGDGNRVIPATPRCPPAWTACPALQRGDIPYCLPALPPLQNGKSSKVSKCGSGGGSSAGRAPCGND